MYRTVLHTVFLYILAWSQRSSMLADDRGEVVINVLADVLTVGVIVNGELAAVVVGVGVGMLADVEIIAVVLPRKTMEFALSVSYGVDLLSGFVLGVLIVALTDVLADINVNVSAAVMIDFNLAIPVPLEESRSLC